MDVLAHTGPSVQPQDEVDLTDDQIQQLLLEAEERLRGPAVSTTQDPEAAPLRYVKTTTLLTVPWLTFCQDSEAILGDRAGAIRSTG